MNAAKVIKPLRVVLVNAIVLATLSCSASPGNGPAAVPEPEILPEESEHFAQVEVSVTVPGESLTIHYTVDGSEPTPESTVFESPFVLGPGTHTVSAIAVDPVGDQSPVVSRSYEVSDGILVTSNADSGPGSLRDAIANAGAGDEIRFAQDMTITLAYSGVDDRRGIQIDRDIQIDGTGRSVVMDTGGAQRHFTFMADDLIVRIANLTLRNGAPDNGGQLPGGSIYVSSGSDLTVDSVQFEDNVGLRGGAIAMEPSGGSLSVIDSVFLRNEARGFGGVVPAEARGFGGAISVRDAGLSVRGSNFQDNFVQQGSGSSDSRSGGAIALRDSQGTVTESEFISNEAWGQGGAIWLYNSSLDVIESLFEENVAGTGGPDGGNVGGGALYSSFGTGQLIRIGRTQFLRNLAAGPDQASVTYLGGALYNSGSVMRVLSSEFFGNGTPGDGRGAAIESTAELTIHSSAFVGNFADPAVANAGAIYAQGDTSIRSSSFAANIGASGREHIYFQSELSTYDLQNVAMDAANYALGASVTVEQSYNVTTSPGFAANPEDGPDNEWGTEDDYYGDLSPGDGSPLIDSGDASFLWTDPLDLDGDDNTAEDEAVDAAGNPRVVGTVDVGAYERQ